MINKFYLSGYGAESIGTVGIGLGLIEVYRIFYKKGFERELSQGFLLEFVTYFMIILVT